MQGTKTFHDEKPKKPQKYRKRFDHEQTREDRCTECGDFPHREGFKCPASNHQCKYVINLDTSVACASRKERNMITTKGPLVHPGHIS